MHPGMFDLHAVPCRIAVCPSRCSVNQVCEISIGTLGEEQTRYRKIKQDLPSALSFDIVHNYRYIMHPRQPTQPAQPTQLNQLNQPTATAFSIASVRRQGRVQSGSTQNSCYLLVCVRLYMPVCACVCLCVRHGAAWRVLSRGLEVHGRSDRSHPCPPGTWQPSLHFQFVTIKTRV